MSPKLPSYPRVVTRPRLARPYVVVNPYGFKVSDHTTLEEAITALRRQPFRNTTFGEWYDERRRQRA